VIVHELYIDAELGESYTLLELFGHERYKVLAACNAPLSPDWHCKVFVRLEYSPLTDDFDTAKNPLHGGQLCLDDPIEIQSPR